MMGLFRAFFLALVVVASSGLVSGQDSRPNVVLILADDLGYGDVRALNPDSTIPTPHLDRLAAEGVTFTDAHSPSAVCTPTRYALLTGRYCWRTRLKSGVLDGYGEPLIEPDRATLGTMLGAAGYRTGIVGKWHLGLGFTRESETDIDFSRPVSDGPHTHGFDFSFVIPASLDFPPYVYIRNGEITRFPRGIQPAQKFPAFLRKGPIGADLVMEDVMDDLLAESVSFITTEAQRPEPFFLYFPLTAPHKPTLPHSRFVGATDLGPYGDFVHQVDWTMGVLLDALETAGVADNTLVIFTSDNGSYMYRRDAADAEDHVDDETIQAYRADRHRANADLRGTKADIWDGGHRVPFFVRWPKGAQAGARVEQPICQTDVFATVAALTGAERPDGAGPDSFSFAKGLAGDSINRAEPVIHHSVRGMFAIRDGKWKLVLGNGSGGREAPPGEPFGRPYALFNMETDTAEASNVIDGHPEVAKTLEETFQIIHTAER